MPLNLNRREKYAVYLAAGLIGLFFLVQFAVFPTIDKRDRLKRILQVKTEILQEMFDLKAEYDTLRRNEKISVGRFSERQKGFRLFSFLDRLAGETRIKDHITYMKPSTSIEKNTQYKITQVEMKLQNITMEQLVSYLYRIETSENIVNVKGISIIKTTKPPGFINTVLKVESVEI
jgi:general secretion pathway protein M